MRNISGFGDRSAYGLPDETGVLVLDVPAGSAAAKSGFRKDDVIRGCGDKPVRTVADLAGFRDWAGGKNLPPGYVEAIRAARRKAAENAPLGFESQSLFDAVKKRAAARRPQTPVARIPPGQTPVIDGRLDEAVWQGTGARLPFQRRLESHSLSTMGAIVDSSVRPGWCPGQIGFSTLMKAPPLQPPPARSTSRTSSPSDSLW